MSRILFDGWPLIHDPLGPAAWHLRTLLALAPESVEPLLAMPSAAPEEPASAPAAVYEPCGERRAWEQRVLPRLAKEHRAAAIHTTGLGAALLGGVPSMVSPAEAADHGERGRLGAALGRGGLARATLLWPQGLPDPELPGNLLSLPPVTHPDFLPGRITARNSSLPEEFILVHGLGSEEAMLRLLEAWSWAAASIGEYYPLVVIEDNLELLKTLGRRLPEFHLGETVKVINEIRVQDIPDLYRAALAVVQVAEASAWGSSLAQALASGRAAVAPESPLTAALAGPAAYLVDIGDARSFGAAMITVAVDEAAREKLEQTALVRAKSWDAAGFQKALLDIYRQVTNR